MKNSASLSLWTLIAAQPLVNAWVPSALKQRPIRPFRQEQDSVRLPGTRVCAKQAGTFFNPVPDGQPDGNNNDGKNDNAAMKEAPKAETLPFAVPWKDDAVDSNPDSFEDNLVKMIKMRKAPSLASQPSTINGKPTAGQGFGNTKKSSGSQKTATTSSNKPYIGIGLADELPSSRSRPLVNDPTKPEYDDQGYTLYTDKKTGEKFRVFEALVEYPCDFMLKIVGINEGSFVQEMVAVVAESCQVSVKQVPHSTRIMGKWMSVTVQAPVQSAAMLYELYENVDRDPRVRFKF